MHLDDLDPDAVYSVVRSLPDREVTVARGEHLMLQWKDTPLAQRFSTIWGNEQSAPGYTAVHCSVETYILVRPMAPDLFVPKESMRTFGRQIDLVPVIACLLTQ